MTRTNKMTLTAMMVSLSIVVNIIMKFIPIVQLGEGGTFFSLTMLPIIYLALILGPLWGVFAGVAYGLLSFMLDGGGYGILGIIFDYVLAFGVIGLVGIFKSKFREGKILPIILGIIVLATIRLLSHTVSSIVVYEATFKYGFLVYNGPVILSATSAVIVVFLLTYKKILKYIINRSSTH